MWLNLQRIDYNPKSRFLWDADRPTLINDDWWIILLVGRWSECTYRHVRTQNFMKALVSRLLGRHVYSAKGIHRMYPNLSPVHYPEIRNGLSTNTKPESRLQIIIVCFSSHSPFGLSKQTNRRKPPPSSWEFRSCVLYKSLTRRNCEFVMST